MTGDTIYSCKRLVFKSLLEDLMSSLTLRISGSVNWGDLVGVKPQFGLKVISIMRQAAASLRYQRALSGQALVPERVSCTQADHWTPSTFGRLWAQWNTRDWEHGDTTCSWISTLVLHSCIQKCGCSLLLCLQICFSVPAPFFFREGELPVLW